MVKLTDYYYCESHIKTLPSYKDLQPLLLANGLLTAAAVVAIAMVRYSDFPSGPGISWVGR